jgi:hypothetical protein
LFGSFFCLNRLGFTDALQGLTNKRFPTLFPENYSFAERKNFIGNALQSDGIKRGSPPLRLENQPAMAGMDRMSDIKRNRKGRIRRKADGKTDGTIKG